MEQEIDWEAYQQGRFRDKIKLAWKDWEIWEKKRPRDLVKRVKEKKKKEKKKKEGETNKG